MNSIVSLSVNPDAQLSIATGLVLLGLAVLAGGVVALITLGVCKAAGLIPPTPDGEDDDRGS